MNEWRRIQRSSSDLILTHWYIETLFFCVTNMTNRFVFFSSWIEQPMFPFGDGPIDFANALPNHGVNTNLQVNLDSDSLGSLAMNRCWPTLTNQQASSGWIDVLRTEIGTINGVGRYKCNHSFGSNKWKWHIFISMLPPALTN